MEFFNFILKNEDEFNKRFKDNEELIYFHFLYIHIILFCCTFDYDTWNIDIIEKCILIFFD